MEERIIRRKVLISIDDVGKEICRFQAVGCTTEATTRNRWAVAMCKNCYGVWNSLRPNNVDPQRRYPKMRLRELPKEEDDGPPDEFYCGEY
tara:strand:+ start:1513 stop:1785 length:273 start_codon:yes stop_codon:yes gene_type:complete